MSIESKAGATRTTESAGAISSGQLSELRDAFEANRRWRNAQNAVTQVSVDDVALNRAVVNTTDHTFSHLLDDWAVTNQKMTGRCWMFAGLNLFRVGAMQKMGLKEFEFSQAYTLFYDKLERSNYVLEAMIELADRPLDDRTVAFLLDRPLEDGGQWNMFVNLVRKHGLVPKAFMPETESSSNTRRLNSILWYKLREGARTLRERRAMGASVEDLREAKLGMMAEIHRILCIHLGTPPATIEWQWTDSDGNFHRDEVMKPQQFAERYITIPLDEYVCLVHDPRRTSPLGRTYTVEYLGNVVGGEIVTYLNVDAELMKQIARDTIVGGEPVWFGCDVGKMMRRDLGLWDRELFEFEAVYEASFSLDKAERLDYHETLMTHAMLFTGVDVADGVSRRWRVENSWGEENGKKGFFVMNDNWFSEYTFEIAARRSMLPEALQAALDQPPIVLPAWDPMGALAR
jgi:bleomycin hydrolase